MFRLHLSLRICNQYFLAALAITISLIQVPLAHAENMHQYLAKTQQLAREGKNKEALERFIWFHEHALEKEPSMAGVRLSFALSAWKQLGDTYAPAKLALIETRDNTKEQVLKKDGTFHQFHDVSAINQEINADDETVELFKKLDQSNPKLAERCWIVAKSLVIEQKDYELAKKYIGDFAESFDQIQLQYDSLKEYSDKNPQSRSVMSFAKKHFVDETIELIKFAVAIDNMAAAKEIQEKALKVIDDPRLRKAIPDDKKEGDKKAADSSKSTEPKVDAPSESKSP